MARPALPRFRADVRIVVELSAEDADHADQRLEVLVDLLRPRLEAAVRGARIGASEALVVDVPTEASAV